MQISNCVSVHDAKVMQSSSAHYELLDEKQQKIMQGTMPPLC